MRPHVRFLRPMYSITKWQWFHQDCFWRIATKPGLFATKPKTTDKWFQFSFFFFCRHWVASAAAITYSSRCTLYRKLLILIASRWIWLQADENLCAIFFSILIDVNCRNLHWVHRFKIEIRNGWYIHSIESVSFVCANKLVLHGHDECNRSRESNAVRTLSLYRLSLTSNDIQLFYHRAAGPATRE